MTDFAIHGFASIDDAEEGAVLELELEDGSPALNGAGEPMTLTLAGADSKAYRKAMQSFQQRALESFTRRKGKQVDQEEMLERNIKMLVQATLDWSGFMDSSGGIVPCTPKNVEALYRTYPSIREQADAFVTTRANFTKASPTISASSPGTNSD